MRNRTISQKQFNDWEQQVASVPKKRKSSVRLEESASAVGLVPLEIGSQDARCSTDIPADTEMVPMIIDGLVETQCLVESEKVVEVHLDLSDSSENYAYRWY